VADHTLKSHRFRTEREGDWRKLDALLQRAQEKSVGSLTDEELVSVPVLYRSTLSSLSVARSISLDQGVTAYLESLCLRAYLFVYGVRSTPLERTSRFFRQDWPAAVRGLWRETLVSALLFALGAVVAYLLIRSDADWYYAFIPEQMAGGRDPSATTADLRETLYGGDGKDGLSMFAAFLFTHNAGIAILAFALGFALCLPTVFLLVYNGASLGAFLALFASRNLGFEASGWLIIHGVTEIFACILAGAAGFRIGWSVIFPGDRARLEAAAEAGRLAATAMVGVVIMLVFAGLLEGFGRQLIKADTVRYAIGLTSLVLWTLYFYLPRGLVRERR
jgi:uncharacterized membrane protein SpoIIM required for sporulation